MNRPPLHADFLKLPIAHRALHDVTQGRPENSRAAIRAAIRAGYGIEIDVQRSADDVSMVFHDHDLSRLTEASGRLDAHHATKLGRMRLRGGEEGIPTLPEVLEIVAGQVPLLIEVKDQDGEMGVRVGALERAVAQALEGYAGPVAVMSFNPHSVQALARHAPQIARGLTTCAYEPEVEHLPCDVCDRLRGIPDYVTTGSVFISHDWRDLRRPRVAELKEDGAVVLCWTVKSLQQEAEAREIAHNITFEQYAAPFPA